MFVECYLNELSVLSSSSLQGAIFWLDGHIYAYGRSHLLRFELFILSISEDIQLPQYRILFTSFMIFGWIVCCDKAISVHIIFAIDVKGCMMYLLHRSSWDRIAWFQIQRGLYKFIS